MSRELQLSTLSFPNLHKVSVGFDQLFGELDRSSMLHRDNYPPYNMIKHSDDSYSIELAVAGFGEGDVELTLNKNVLVIDGIHPGSSEDDPTEYLHRGISSRNFARSFTLAEHVEVKAATVLNGILTIDLERKVPESAKPKAIAITYKK